MKKILAILALSCISSTATAATVGFGIDLRGTNKDRPVIRIYNISDSAKLTNFTMTIGNTAYNFDRVNVVANTPGGTATLTNGDTVNGGVRVNQIAYSFTGFDAGEVFRFRAEIDPDNSNAVLDYRTIFFNNGPSANSLVTATFATLGGPIVVSRRLADRDATLNRFRYNASVEIAPVPLPAGGVLMLAGLAGLAMVRRKKG